jgi:3-methyladenine DNA glycosylase AlkD
MTNKPDLTPWRQRKWTTQDYHELLDFLRTHADECYRVFNEQTLKGQRPTLGVRLSLLRPLSQQIARAPHVRAYLKLPKGASHEEVLLEGMVIGAAKLPYPELQPLISVHVNKIDSWGLCDGFVCPPLLTGHEQAFYPEIKKYLASANPWAKRFAYVTMMTYYLNHNYLTAVLHAIKHETSRHYYVQMAQAWLLATAWPKHRSTIKHFLITNRPTLPPKLLKMTAQKLRDSRLVPITDKNWSKTL